MSEFYTVYAIDLLGFGASEKPAGFSYKMEVWAQVHVLLLTSYFVRGSSLLFTLTGKYGFTEQLILDFLNEVIKKPTVLIGNSVGSLACVIAASG